jgi:uncharacterized protein (DUF58 family)
MIPAPRAIVAALLATLALAVAVAVPAIAIAALAADVLLLAAILLDGRRAAAVPLAAHRRWPPLLVQGAPASIEVRLSAPAGVRVVAREALHPALAEHPLRQRLVGAAPDGVAWDYTIVPRRRGEHDVGPLTVRVLGPWGLAWAQRDLLPGEPRRVYPQTRWRGRVGRLLALAHRRELGRAPLRLRGMGTEPYALRDYRPGDPPTRIQWKASARHGRLIAREDTWERGMRLVVLLDCARAMASADRGWSKLDHALAAALAVVRVGLSRGDRVTVIGFSDRVERVVRARSGRRAAGEAYAALYDLEPRLAEPAYDLAVETASAVEPRRATVMLLTSVVDLAAAELLRTALLRLARRHRPVLVNLEDPDLVRLAFGVPERTEEAFAKASALEMLLANRRLGRRLRRAGIAVSAAAADALAWRALESYLSAVRMPRRGGQSSRVQSAGQAPSTMASSPAERTKQSRPLESPQNQRTPVVPGRSGKAT